MEKLTEIKYQRPQVELLEQNFAEKLAEFKNAGGFASAKVVLTKLNQMLTETMSMVMLASYRHTIDIHDEFYDAENTYWDENFPRVTALQTQLAQAILASPFKVDLVADGLVPKPYLLMAENQIATFSEKLIPEFQRESSLSSQYDNLIASAQVEFAGEKLTLPQLAKHFSDLDRDVRKRAQEDHTQWFVDHEAELDEIYDQLVKVRTKIAHELGFANYTEMSLKVMNRFGYDQPMIRQYRENIKKYVTPFVVRYYQRQAKRFGQTSLPYYDLDLEFPSGNAVPEGTPAELVAKAQSMYQEMSNDTGEFFEMMIDRDAMDLVAHKGKMSGGYAEFMPKWQLPIIFANFNGTSGDIDVLTHEAGHAFQSYQARWISWNEMQFPSTEAAEIFSMSMEFLAYPYLERFFGPQTAKYKYSHLAGTLTFLPYGALVDEFQDEVYTHPEMSPAARKDLWRKLEQEYLPYKDYQDNDGLERGLYWMRQGHIFTTPFYYIDYTIAQVVAQQFYQRAILQHDDTAFADYQTMATAGGSKTLMELIELGHLQSPFAGDTMQKIVADLEAQLDAVPESDLQ